MEEKLAQRAEIALDDYSLFAEILMENGYEVMTYLDKESNTVIVEYVHPEYTGHCFAEIEA